VDKPKDNACGSVSSRKGKIELVEQSIRAKNTQVLERDQKSPSSYRGLSPALWPIDFKNFISFIDCYHPNFYNSAVNMVSTLYMWVLPLQVQPTADSML
jgi:hypothetical protein